MKKVFPKEFSDLLNKKGLSILSGKTRGHSDGKIAVVQNILQLEYVASILPELQKKVFPVLKNYRAPIPEDSIWKLKKNYTEKLGKTMKMMTAEMNAKNSKAYRIAWDMGLIDMLSSVSYKSLGETLLGEKFGESNGKQVICYQQGDYVSPHNDHHPENDNTKNGYYDIQLMMSNKYVKHQWLVYEKNGFLNSMADIATPSGIAVYHLPFWHYTTPMIADPGNPDGALRWLFLHSFEHTG